MGVTGPLGHVCQLMLKDESTQKYVHSVGFFDTEIDDFKSETREVVMTRLQEAVKKLSQYRNSDKKRVTKRGRPKKYASNAERQRAYRERRQEEETARVKRIIGLKRRRKIDPDRII